MGIMFVAAASAAGGASTQTLVCNKPTGTAQDDVMVAIFVIPQGNTATNPSGWTTLNTQNASTGTTIVTMWKLAGASEASTYTFTRSAAGTTKAATILTFRGVDLGSPIRTNASNSGAATTSLTSAAVSGVLATDMTVRMGGARPEASNTTAVITATTTGGWNVPTGGASGATTGDTFPATSASAYLLGGNTGGFTTNVSSGIGSGTVVLKARPDSVGLMIG